MNAPTDWGSAVAMLAAGLILGLVFFVFFNRRKGSATFGAEPDLELRDLTVKRDLLVRELRDLESSSLPADQLAAEQARLERETAEVLRRIDSYRRDDSAAAQTPAPSNRMNPTVKGFLWGAGSFAALAALGWFVMESMDPRPPDGLVTGGVESQQQASAPDPILMQMETAVQNDPDNLQLRNDLAQAYLERDNLMGVFEQTRYVLERNPSDPRAMTFQALVRLAMGEADLAKSMLEEATRIDPKNLDAWVSLAWIHAQQDRMPEAERMIAEAARNSPGDKQRLEDVFTQMKAHAAQLAAAPAGGETLPAGHPPVEGAPQPAPGAAVSDGRSVTVTLDLDPAASLRRGILFVMARPLAGGPPVAVKRLQVAAFPVTIELGSADSMMGQPLPDIFRLEARLDSDGDAATRPPTDPAAMQANVAPGATVRLALK